MPRTETEGRHIDPITVKAIAAAHHARLQVVLEDSRHWIGQSFRSLLALYHQKLGEPILPVNLPRPIDLWGGRERPVTCDRVRFFGELVLFYGADGDGELAEIDLQDADSFDVIALNEWLRAGDYDFSLFADR